MYQSSGPGMAGRGRQPMSWKGKVAQYLSERVDGELLGLERAKELYRDREDMEVFLL